MKLALLGTIATILCAALLPVSASAATCERACLEGMVNRYMAALIAHDPSGLPFANDVIFAENNNRLKIGEGSWQTIDGLGKYKHYMADPEGGQVGFIGTVTEFGIPAFMDVRLRIAGGKIAEVESYVMRDEGAAHRYDEMGEPEAPWLAAVPPAQRLSRAQLWQAVGLGVIYGLAQILQTLGLDRTPASTAGFVTGLYVVMTPLLAAPLLRQRIPGAAWLAVVLATAGMGVLSLRGLEVGGGELLVLFGALGYALHICGLGAWSTPESAMGSSIVQLFVIAAICLVCAAPGGITVPDNGPDWVRMAYMAAIVGALGMLAQVWAQAHLPPTRSAVIMSMEPVFAALFAVLFGGESLTGRMVFGGLMVLAAMLLVELAPRRRVEGEVQHLTV